MQALEPIIPDSSLQKIDSNHMLLHQHLIANDGSNIGYSGDKGIGEDSKELIGEMIESKEYKGVKLDKFFMDEAINLLSERYRKEDYKIFNHNCQNFIDDSIQLANEIASLYGKSLFLK